jgi:hypothetical protein
MEVAAMATKPTSPHLTVKALAEMLRMPAYEQSRLLYDQKYPKQQPQSFRTPYYQRALSGIRDYYRRGNEAKILRSAKNDLQSIGSVPRRTNNLRVLDSFIGSSQAKRKLHSLPNRRYSAMTGSVEIRLSPDLQALEKDALKVTYFNCRVAAITEEIAGLTIEIAHWVLTQNQVAVDFDQIEVIDLAATGKVHRRTSGRRSTINAIKNNGKIIEALWSTV